jgi:hypothetical protein
MTKTIRKALAHKYGKRIIAMKAQLIAGAMMILYRVGDGRWTASFGQLQPQRKL